MASFPAAFEENLFCPVCQDVFRDPVLLLCSHTFCRLCLEQYWQHAEFQTCPLCRMNSSLDTPPSNLALKNLCKAFIQQKCQAASAWSEPLCKPHKQKVTHFCLEDMQPVCMECQRSEIHMNHCFKLLDEAAVELKLDMKKRLEPLKERLKHFKNVKSTCIQTEEHIKVQTQHAEAQIKREFEKLHHFLWDEEAARIAALRAEMRWRIQMVKKKTAQLNRIILAVANEITATEEEAETNNVSFLQNYKATLEKVQCNLKDPEIREGSLMDVAEHLGNLAFRVWEKMRSIIQYTPVILDPNTAHPCLHISDDLTEAKLCHGDPWLPHNPERFNGYPSVLGSEGFNAGSHTWVVEVGDSTAWAVGVICESLSKDRENLTKHGLWQVGYYKGKYGEGMSGERLMPLALKETLQHIRVLLDWDRGLITFLNPLNNTHVHTFRQTFTERVYPYFYNACPAKALKVLPELAVTTKYIMLV